MASYMQGNNSQTTGMDRRANYNYESGACSHVIRHTVPAGIIALAGAGAQLGSRAGSTLPTPTPPAYQGLSFPFPQELLREVLQHVPCCQWPLMRQVNKQFEAAVATLVTSISIRHWPSSAHKPSSITVSSSSSLRHTQQLASVVDNEAHLQQLLKLLVQLPCVTQLSMRGLKPLAALAVSQPGLHKLPGIDSSANLLSSTAAAAALAGLTRLDLPDSSSSSLPAALQLPHLTTMQLFAVDSVRRLAGFAPQLQHLECFSLMVCSSSTSSSMRPDLLADNPLPGEADTLPTCRKLSVHFITGSSSGQEVLTGLAVAFPGLRQLLTLPQLQCHTPTDTGAPSQQQWQQLTHDELQAALLGLRTSN